MEKIKYLLFGAGGHAKVVNSIINDKEGDLVSVIDQDVSILTFQGVKVTQKPEVKEKCHAIIGIGNNKFRKEIALKNSLNYTSISHSSSLIDSSVLIGTGTVIMQGSIIQIDAKIGSHVIVNTGAKIDHDCVIGDYAHLAPGATLCGNVIVGEGVLIGAGATILPNVIIGDWAVVGAGAVVTSNIPPGSTYAGVPAKKIK